MAGNAGKEEERTKRKSNRFHLRSQVSSHGSKGSSKDHGSTGSLK